MSLRVCVCYPFPLDARETFEPFARRYVESFQKYPPGCDHDFFLAYMNPATRMIGAKVVLSEPLVEDFKSFDPLNPTVFKVWSDGIDIGCAQTMAPNLADMEYDFAVFSTSRVYFHREGWLRRLVEARENYGDGLYGATGSYECPNGEPEKFPNPHMRTVLYGCNPRIMANMAEVCPVTNRVSAHKFEAGRWNFAQFFYDLGRPVKMVTWNEELDVNDWRKPDSIFRRGDQSNILCHDKHSDAYLDASPEEKRRLERITG